MADWETHLVPVTFRVERPNPERDRILADLKQRTVTWKMLIAAIARRRTEIANRDYEERLARWEESRREWHVATGTSPEDPHIDLRDSRDYKSQEFRMTTPEMSVEDWCLRGGDSDVIVS